MRYTNKKTSNSANHKSRFSSTENPCVAGSIPALTTKGLSSESLVKRVPGIELVR
jgi:hypothetical protein